MNLAALVLCGFVALIVGTHASSMQGEAAAREMTEGGPAALSEDIDVSDNSPNYECFLPVAQSGISSHRDTACAEFIDSDFSFMVAPQDSFRAGIGGMEVETFFVQRPVHYFGFGVHTHLIGRSLAAVLVFNDGNNPLRHCDRRMAFSRASILNCYGPTRIHNHVSPQLAFGRFFCTSGKASGVTP